MSDMEFTKYWTSERARKKQTALTKLSNGLLKEVIENPLATELFEPEEIEAMVEDIRIPKGSGAAQDH